MTFTKKTTITVSVIAISLIIGVLSIYYILFFPNISAKTDEKAYLYIYPNSTFATVVGGISQKAEISNSATFNLTAKLLKYNNKTIRAGRYEIPKQTGNMAFLRMLRNGQQTPVKLSFNNIRTGEQLAGRLGEQLLTDSLTFINLLNDSAFLAQYNFTPENAKAMFIPDTYDIYWTIKPQDFFKRMDNEYQAFWTESRKQKAAAIPLTPLQVSVLASIVEEESNNQAERPIIAGLYINRLKNDLKLQADPTVKYALGDFGLRRIMVSDILKARNPYNTYLYHGLPPAPIRIASKSAIDAVLNFVHHNYLYMCAKETFDGTHNFAVTYAEHQQNAKKYQQALNARNIK